MTAIDLPQTAQPEAVPPRNTFRAMRNGMRHRCPSCGEGRLYQGYLTTVEHCTRCGEAIHHHRADDGPAYITIMIVAHIFGPALMLVYMLWAPSPVVLATGFCLATIAAVLLLLPVAKGGLVGLQWAKRMHGFDSTAPRRHPEMEA